MVGRIFQTESRADRRLEESRAGVCLVHCCVLTPGTESVPSEYLAGEGEEKLGVSRAQKTQKGVRGEEVEPQDRREHVLNH